MKKLNNFIKKKKIDKTVESFRKSDFNFEKKNFNLSIYLLMINQGD